MTLKRTHTSTQTVIGTPFDDEPAAFDILTGRRIVPRSNPFLCFVVPPDDPPPGPPPGDPPPDPPPPSITMTQDQFDTTVERRLGKQKRSFEAQIAGLTAQVSTAAEMKTELDELKDQMAETAAGRKGVSKAEQELAKLTRDHTKTLASLEQFTANNATLTTERDGAVGQLRTHVIGGEIRKALSAAGCLPGTPLDHATMLLIAESGAELTEENGKTIVTLTVPGLGETDDTAEAAKRYLAANKHFAAHPGGGGGTKPPNAGGGPPKLTGDLTTQDPATLIVGGMNQRSRSS